MDLVNNLLYFGVIGTDNIILKKTHSNGEIDMIIYCSSVCNIFKFFSVFKTKVDSQIHYTSVK